MNMKKVIIGALIFGFCTKIFASDTDGLKAYENHCMSCHIMATKDDVGGHNHGENIIAPPAHRVHEMIKQKYPQKEDFEIFVSDFIKNPTKEKANCKGAVKKFGLMPPIGMGMSEENIKMATDYLYNLTVEDVRDYQKSKKQ